MITLTMSWVGVVWSAVGVLLIIVYGVIGVWIGNRLNRK